MSETYCLVSCEKKYWEFVRNLRNDDRVKSGFIQSSHISKKSHITYMKKNFLNYKIALYKKKPAGYVGVIDKDIRVCTDPIFQGKGVGKFMINNAIKLWEDSIAKVKKNNKASLNLFNACGFSQFKNDDDYIYLKINKINK